MVGRAKSLDEKRAENARIKEELVQEAVHRYQDQISHTAGGNRPKRKSMQTIARAISQDNPQAARKQLVPTQSTISRRLRGKPSLKDARERQSHLTEAESTVVIDYIIELSNRCIPFSHKRLKEHAEEIIRAQTPGFQSLGKNWTHRFVVKHKNQLSTYCSRALDVKRASAVNPTTNAAWFKLLEDTVRENDIEDENVYGMDETGIQGGDGESERVIGAAGKSIQGQTQGGGRENNTVMTTICGDGTSIPPTVIFKGQSYLLQWKQDNPLNASIAHSPKGWVTGEIAVEWIQDFDAKTSEKAGGKPRLLLLDGHSSHLSWAFLEYARKRNIIILGYPAHATHIYQGLDVVCFGPFKKAWSKYRREYELETGLTVNKTNFLGVLGRAYTEAFTPETIRTAFRKTGVIPLDPNAISPTALAPSVETSTKGSLPIQQPTPIREVVDVLMTSLSDDEGVKTSSIAADLRTALTSTSVGFLVDSSDVPVDHPSLPLPVAASIEPMSQTSIELLDYVPQTKQEARLLGALHELADRDHQLCNALRASSATAVLQGLYCERLKKQLYSKESSRKESGHLLGNGLPVMLTGDEFFKRVTDQQARREQDAQLKEARTKVSNRYKDLLLAWRKDERARIDRNKADAKRFDTEMNAWKAERALAKHENRQPRWAKPVKPPRRKPVPKPTRNDVESSGSTDDESDREEEESGKLVSRRTMMTKFLLLFVIDASGGEPRAASQVPGSV